MPVVQRFRWWPALALLAVMLSGAPDAARAQSCYINGAFGMNFGTVSSNGQSAVSSISVTCLPDYSGGNQTFQYQLCTYIGPGNFSAGQPTRRMGNYNGAYLNYDLFADPARTLLIGAPGSTPVYQVALLVPPGAPQTMSVPVHGWVYPGQSVPAVAGFQEVGHQGLLAYRYGTAGFQAGADCNSGGSGGGSTPFYSSAVEASYDNGCAISATDLDFGQATPPQYALRATANIHVQCPPDTPWKVGLDNGEHFDGGMRRMRGSGGYVKYQLYLDQSLSVIWEATGPNMASGITSSGRNTISLTVYGEVPPQPDAQAGTYADTIVATLYY